MFRVSITMRFSLSSLRSKHPFPISLLVCLMKTFFWVVFLIVGCGCAYFLVEEKDIVFMRIAFPFHLNYEYNLIRGLNLT